MNVYEVTFDASTYIVVAKDEEELLDLLHKTDAGFQREKGKGIVYIWRGFSISECHVHIVPMKPHVVFSVQH